LYIWDDNRISKKEKAHPDAPILALHTINDTSIFASGAMDGKIILWSLGLSEYSYIVEKIYEYSISNEEFNKTIANPKYHI
jgi:hypothetical protein